MKSDIFPCKHQGRNKKEGQLAILKGAMTKWLIKIQCQSGRVHVLPLLCKHPRKALTFRWPFIVLYATPLQCLRSPAVIYKLRGSLGPEMSHPRPWGSFWNSQASLPLRSKVWSLRPDRPSRLSNLMKGVLVFSRNTRTPCGRALSQHMVHLSEVHTALLSHSCHILGPSLGSTGSKPQVWGRQGRLMKGFFSLHRDSKLSWFLHFY